MAEKTMKELLNFGIIIIDKPSGPTSFSVSEYVCKRLKLPKTSHFGTLDPLVTGVLPVALGRGCKLTGFFLGHDKTYVGIMHTHKEQDMKELQKIIDECPSFYPAYLDMGTRLLSENIEKATIILDTGFEILTNSIFFLDIPNLIISFKLSLT